MALLEEIMAMQGLGAQPGSFPLMPQEQFDPAAEAQAAREAAAARMAAGVRSPARAAAAQPAFGPFPGLLGLEMNGMQPTEQVDGNAPAPAAQVMTSGPSIREQREGPPEYGAPLDITPQATDGTEPVPNATATAGRAPMSMMPAPAEPGFLEQIGKKVFNPANAGTFLALGGGFAGAPSFGTGMRRAFSAASAPAMQSVALGQKTDSQGATYRALIAKGVPPHEALAATLNPDVMKATAAKYFETKPRTVHDMTDAIGNKTPTTFDPNNGKFYDMSGKEITGKPGENGMPGAAGSMSPEHDEHGRDEKFLAELDPVAQSAVKAIVSGDANASSRNIQKYLPYATRYDKNFTGQQDYATRLKTRQDYLNGPSSKVTKSLNTTIDHGSHLYDSIDQLGNLETLPALNAPINAVKGQFSKDYQKARANFDSNKEAFIKELDFALSGGRPTVAGSTAIRNEFDAQSSPVTQKAYIQRSMELLKSRIEAHENGYVKGMGSAKGMPQIIDTKNQENFQRIVGGASSDSQAPQAPVAPLAPGQSKQIGNVTIRRLN